MRQKLTPLLCAALEIGAVGFTLWLWYYAALAMNNHARVAGVPLPRMIGWFVWASRYRLTVLIGLAFACLVVAKTTRGTAAWNRAVALTLAGLLLGSAIIFTIFSISVGSCLCDGWKHY